MNPYEPPTDTLPKSKLKLRRKRDQPDPADAVGAVLMAILMFVLILVAMLTRS